MTGTHLTLLFATTFNFTNQLYRALPNNGKSTTNNKPLQQTRTEINVLEEIKLLNQVIDLQYAQPKETYKELRDQLISLDNYAARITKLSNLGTRVDDERRKTFAKIKSLKEKIHAKIDAVLKQPSFDFGTLSQDDLKVELYELREELYTRPEAETAEFVKDNNVRATNLFNALEKSQYTSFTPDQKKHAIGFFQAYFLLGL